MLVDLIDDDQDGIREAMDAGMYKAALSALLAFPSSGSVQESCSWVICEAEGWHERFRGYYKEIDEPACKAVVAALNAFPASPAIQQNGCAILGYVASDDQSERLLVDLGACQAVVKKGAYIVSPQHGGPE